VRGAVSLTRVYRVGEGGVVCVLPKHRLRSKSGRHGEDVWRLDSGKYLVISITRPNNVNAPYTVTTSCLSVEGGAATMRVLTTFYENDLETALLRAKELTHHCQGGGQAG
jgi:hypothetical protein